jgi:hypothetical protein
MHLRNFFYYFFSLFTTFHTFKIGFYLLSNATVPSIFLCRYIAAELLKGSYIKDILATIRFEFRKARNSYKAFFRSAIPAKKKLKYLYTKANLITKQRFIISSFIFKSFIFSSRFYFGYFSTFKA